MSPEEKELAKVKKAANDCLEEGAFLKVVIMEHKNEFHVLTPAMFRQVFTTHEAACRWASVFFLVASAMPTLKERKDSLDKDRG